MANQREGNAAAFGFWVRLTDALTPPLGPELPEELRRQYRTTAAFILIGSVIFFGFGLLNTRLGNVVPAVTDQVVTVVLLSMLLPLRRGYVRLAAHVGIIGTTITIGLAMWYGGGMAAAAVVFLPMLPAIGLLSIGRSGGYAGLVQALMLVVVVAGAEMLGYEPFHEPPDKLFVKRVAEAVVVVLQIWAISRAFFKLKDEAFELLSANRDELAGLLNNMRQGVLAFAADGRVSGRYSEQAKAVFGKARLDDCDVVELLYPDLPPYDVERQHFEEWRERVFDSAEAGWEEVASLAPARCIRHEGTPAEQHLKLEFRPIFERGLVGRVMLLATDETEKVILQRAADAEKVAHERMIGRMRRLAASGAYRFLEFLRSAELRIEEIERAFSPPAPAPERADLAHFFRHVHTIRSEARTYELDRLEALMATAEQMFGRMRSTPGPGDEAWARELATTAAAAAAEVRQARESLVAASPIGAAILDQATVRRSDLAALRDHVLALQGHRGDELAPLVEITSRLASRPFGESVGGLADAAQRWAEQRGKRATLEIAGKEVLVPPRLAEVLPGVLTHLTRNAVAHGVELPEDRRRADKPETGVIRIECTDSSGGVVLAVSDDGAGIDQAAVQRRASELGLAGGDALELLFHDGLSTSQASDGLSGAGVGMAAVREALRSAGYEIAVASERGRGTSFTLRPAI